MPQEFAKPMRVVTRFAPSPTGMLHIGGARTALFNYLFARRHGGQFLLRIEDTDRERSTSEATAAIFEAMDWLGLNPDAPPVMQSTRAERHAEVAHAMIVRGTAFRCYVSAEELEARRDLGQKKRLAAHEQGLDEVERAKLLAEAASLLAPFRSPWREGGQPPSPDAPFTVRLRAPDTDMEVVQDAVQGTVQVHGSEIDDLVLLRTDGTPTYMLAVVVDDHDMGITHVIRGDDHLRNTFRQIPIYRGMGWEIPKFAHLPMIHGNDGMKLSKRHGAVSTTAYRDMGYLPEAMKAYLLRLGWSHGNQEIFAEEEAIRFFDLAGVNKAPARLDLDKLNAVNTHFLRQRSDGELLSLLEPFFGAELPLGRVERERIARSLPELKTRGATLAELARNFDFLRVARPIPMNEDARRRLSPDALERLRQLVDIFSDVNDWQRAGIAAAISSYCTAAGIKLGQIGPPLRAALTGGLPAPDLAPVMEWLGKDESLGRIRDQLVIPA